MTRRSEWLSFAMEVGRITDESDRRYLATAFAYYAFLSLMPLLVMTVVNAVLHTDPDELPAAGI